MLVFDKTRDAEEAGWALQAFGIERDYRWFYHRGDYFVLPLTMIKDRTQQLYVGGAPMTAVPAEFVRQRGRAKTKMWKGEKTDEA